MSYYTNANIADPNRIVRAFGKRYRVCVYRTARGWSSFVEDDTYNLGYTGESSTERVAWHKALRILAADGAEQLAKVA